MGLKTATLLVLGLALLLGGAEVLIRGASRLALRLRLTPLVVGLTVVAVGTSAPEIAVTLDGVRSGVGGLAVGNVVGSNIFNVLCVLGLAGLVAPLVVPSQLVRLDVPVMIGATVLVAALAADGTLTNREGWALLALGAVYLALLFRQARSDGASSGATGTDDLPGGRPGGRGLAGIVLELGFVAAGLVLLIVGARWLVDGAVVVARTAGVSPALIGLTVVAVGTSLPEVATSVMASIRGARELAVGNVVGSNVSNLLIVLGAAAVLAPGPGLGFPEGTFLRDVPVMLAAALACLPIFFTGHRISRWEAALFLGFYAAYLLFLILDATGHRAEDPLARVMLGIVVPLSALTLGVLAFRQLRSSGRGG